MNHRPHGQARRPTHFASAVLVWLAALLSFGGLSPSALPDTTAPRAAATDAARAGDLPAQRSTAPSLQNRLILAEAAVESASGSGYDDGHDPALAPDTHVNLPAPHLAHGGRYASPSSTVARIAGFLARAPPILA